MNVFAFTGVRSQLLISAEQLLPRGYLQKVEFLDLRGHIIDGHEYTLEPDPDHEGIYRVSDIVPPGEYFHIRVKGIDSQNYMFQRITAAAVSPLVPGMFYLHHCLKCSGHVTYMWLTYTITHAMYV